MKTKYKAAVAALAFAALVAQPVAAHVSKAHVHGGLPVLWGAGFLFCTGMTMGKQDSVAAANGTAVSDADRVHAFLGCIFPPFGLAKLYRGG